MTDSPLFWLLTTLFWTLVMSFYSTQEMASISCNRLRLEYSVKQNKPWAKWLAELIEHPTKLFTTTLIGVNVALMASSESARRLYEALGLNPNFAPLTHIPFILLFGELVPMFAARTHAEHMSRLGIGLLYLSSKIVSPFSAIVDLCFRQLSRYAVGKETREAAAFLSREELQKLIEEHEIGLTPEHDQQFNAIIGKIFSLRSQEALQLMEKLHNVPTLPFHTSIAQARIEFEKITENYFLIYRHTSQKIIGVIRPQDLLEGNDNKKIGDYVQPACFVSEYINGLELLPLLQEEKTGLGVVINSAGHALGVITIDDIFDELFTVELDQEENKPKQLTYLEKTFPAEMHIHDFNEAYQMHIDPQGCTTFAELIEQILGRNPGVGDLLFIDPIEIIVKETSLFKAKTILIQTR